MSPIKPIRMTNYRWYICVLLFLAVTINYLDRQVLPLTWQDFILPEFAWDEESYGRIIAFFSIVYAFGMLISGYAVYKLGVKKGFAIAVCLWSFGAILHGFCGIFTSGILTGNWFVDFTTAKEKIYESGVNGLSITAVSIYLFMFCRFVLAIGQSGCFPAAITAIVEYFPKKDRAFAISVFNNGAAMGAMLAPLLIPMLARSVGWEKSFIIVGSIGFLWVIAWLIMYKRAKVSKHVNLEELNYILQDEVVQDESGKHASADSSASDVSALVLGDMRETGHVGLLNSLSFRKTWALLVAKFLTEGAWWFYLFWLPVFLSEFYSYTTDSYMGIAMIIVIYLISVLSIGGGYLPTIFINKLRLDPYTSRMRALLVFACVQLIGLFTVPLGEYSPWLLVIVVGLQAASHQSWSANVFAMVGDFFPRRSVAVITGVIGAAGGLSSYIVMRGFTILFKFVGQSYSSFSVFGYSGKMLVYMLSFCVFSVLYLMAWGIMKALVPKPETAPSPLIL